MPASVDDGPSVGGDARGEGPPFGHPRFDIAAIVLGVLFSVLWSSAFSAAKIALDDAPPFLLQTARFLLAGCVGVAIAFALNQPLPRSRADWRAITLLGLCQNTIYLGLMFVALNVIAASLTAIIASTLPLMVAAAGAALFREKLGGIRMIGLVLGFGGACAVMADRLSGGADPFGVAVCLAGIVALTVATLLARHARVATGMLMLVALQQFVGGLALVPIALAFERFDMVTPTPSLAVSFLWLAFVPGLLATLLWFLLIRRIGAQEASAYHFLNPGFGVAIAWLLLGERLGPGDILGVIVVAVGILLVQRGGPTARP